MPKRGIEGRYHYGFNGMEKDDEVKGDNNSLDFGARIYDPRLGRWLSLDPLAAKYADLSPYNFTANNPILLVDPDGKEIDIYFTDKDGKTQFVTYTADMVGNTGNTFVDDAINTLNSLRGTSETAKGIIDKAVETKQIVELKYTNKDGNRSFKDGKLRWSPVIGDVYTIADPESLEYVQAPSLTLVHELDHFAKNAELLDAIEKAKIEGGEHFEDTENYKIAKKALHDFEFTDEGQENEENRATADETKVANELHMGTRPDYNEVGEMIKTESPTSTKPAQDNTHEKKLNEENKKGAGSKSK